MFFYILDDFQKYVLYIVGFLFVIIISGLSIIILKNRKILSGENKIKVSKCPDYWIENNEKNKCVNNKHLGTCNIDEIDYSLFKNKDNELCNKSKWAKDCDLTWDGITNNSNIKCNK